MKSQHNVINGTFVIGIIAVATSLYSISVGVWIVMQGEHSRPEVLKDYQYDLNCYKCLGQSPEDDESCHGDNISWCRERGWSNIQLPTKICNFDEVLNDMTEDEFADLWTDFYDFHRTWRTIENYENGDIGADVNSFHKGTKGLHINESALYLLYGRLTFRCTTKGGPTRIEMEVLARENEPPDLRTLLKDVQFATCNEANNDLLTTQQSSILRLMKNSKLSMRFRAPKYVSLSQGDGKSSIGVVRIGNS